MSVTNDRDRFFQTDISIAESARKKRKSSNTLGEPVKFPTKILGLKINRFLDTSGNSLFVAEAGGTVSATKLSESAISRLGKGSQAPITCLECYAGKSQASDGTVVHYVFAGGWDKTITRFTLNAASSVQVTEQISFKAHQDFVKCLLIAQTADGEHVLLSGGADGDISVWTLAGERIATLRPQSRGIECLTLDPFSTPEAPVVYFSTSQREIYNFVLPAITDIRGRSIKWSQPLVQHETSVYKMTFDNDGDMWTASADKTAKRLVRENNFVADTTLQHPDFVRDIVVYEPSALAITACRDEEIRVWNTGTSQLLHVFTGHFEEVTALGISGNTLLSVSIDATLRRWSLAPQDLKVAIENSKKDLLAQEPEPPSTFGGLTAEEEAELQALMDDEEADSLEAMARDDQ